MKEKSKESRARIAAIIPARWASSRFPGKPLHVIAGKPLVQHVWERCRSARGLARVIIATDDARIATAAAGFGAEVVVTSSRHRSGTDRVGEVARKLRGISHVLNIQGDEPVIDPAVIEKLAGSLANDPGIEMITAATPFAEEDDLSNPNAVKVVLNRHHDAVYFSRSCIPFNRDQRPGTRYYRHQGIYGYTRAFLLRFIKWRPGPLEMAEQLEQLRALEQGAAIRVLITRHASIGVDTPADVGLVETLLPPS